MHIITDPGKDIPTASKPSGAYEWWYFDAISDDGETALVIIFYEGIPFSPRYNAKLKNATTQPARPEEHPAISISVYHKSKPVYYSLTEFRPQDFSSRDEPLSVQIGSHWLEQSRGDGKLQYRLRLLETLPDGDAIDAELTFISRSTSNGLLHEGEGDRHVWNPVQPSAEVSGQISISGYRSYKFDFSGTGYHDHNYGAELMSQAFRDWYWGRIHFPEAVLVYYLMNGHTDTQYRGWLIERSNQEVISEFTSIETDEPQPTLFRLPVCRRLQLAGPDVRAEVYQNTAVDNGPFYVRYLCEAVLHVPEWGLQKQTGISEYIYPSRIPRKLFRPLVHMRYRYADRPPHWVQRSPRLYRWTW